MSSSADTTGVVRKVGPYRVGNRIGAGGMGEVYRGFDERLERPVALKHIRAEALKRSSSLARFRREARAIARLNHPTIIQIHDWVETDDGCWYVMELVEGQTLKRLIAAGALAPELVLTIGCALAEGLEVAHAAGIVHRDLKPDNIMIAADTGRIKILDFGLAKQFQDDRDVSLTEAGRIIGTVSAMSPEQAMGYAVDERSDLFSFGILLYEAATGKSPFRQKNAVSTLAHICSERQRPAAEVQPGVPWELSQLIDHMLEKKPEDRPQKASDVLAQLRQIAADSGTSSLERVFDVPLTESVTRVAGIRKEPSSVLDSDGFSRRTSERRQITVVSAELVTGGGDGLDVETLFELLPQMEALAQELAHKWHGHLEQVLDHRLVLCFGYPTAQGDEARRAALAALELVERVAGFDKDSPAGLAARAGIDTGLAVVAVDDRGERLVLGRILDVASAVQGAAGPGRVALSATTHGLIERFVECVEETPIQMPGTSDPEPIYRVDEVRDFAAPGRDLELVARREELELLLGRWRLAKTGDGQVVQLSGITGVGKSRLVRELAGRLAEEGVEHWTLHGSPDDRGSPLRPVLRLLRRALGLDLPEVSAEDGLARLETFLNQQGLSPEDNVPFLAPLLSLQTGERYPITDLGPRLQQRKIQEALLSLLLATTDSRPLLLVVEDLQWLDPSSLELLGLLVEEAEACPLLLILTHRPDFEVPWKQRTHLTRIPLGRLDQQASEEMIEKVAGRPLAAAVRDLVIAKTDGIPLFLEELTKSMLESEKLVERDGRLELAGPVDRLALPTTLRDSLSARLDRLGPARQVALVAAVLGRRFSRELLAAVTELDVGDLQPALDQLVSSELMLRRGYGARRRYVFKHGMIREAAYDSLLASEHRRLHGRVAEVLADRPQVGERQPERLAHHLTKAGRRKRAVRWWLAAGELAISRSAHREGLDHLRRGLELIAGLPASAERDRQELLLVTRLAATASVLSGYSAPEVEGYWGRARELCGTLEDSPQLFWVLWGLWSFHQVRADLTTALDLAQRLLRIADEAGDDSLRLTALAALGLAHYFRGELEPARRELDRGAELDDPERAQPVASATGQDSGVTVLVTRALVLWHLGDDRGAVRSCDAAIALAKRIGHSYSLAFAHVYAARLQQSRRDAEALGEHAQAVVALSQERGFFWITQGRFFLGCRAAENARRAAADGAPEAERAELLAQARSLMTTSLESYVAAGAGLSRTYMLAQLAEIELLAGDAAAAGKHLEQAFGLLANGERYWQPELLRLRGELALADGRTDEAREPLEQALALAAGHGDRAFLLRAALALARRRRGPGDVEALRQVVAAFDAEASSPDLDEAREVLAG